MTSSSNLSRQNRAGIQNIADVLEGTPAIPPNGFNKLSFTLALLRPAATTNGHNSEKIRMYERLIAQAK